MTTTGPISAHADWTDREDDRITGTLTFSLTKEDDAQLTAQGKEPQFLLTGSTRNNTVTALNDYGDEPFHASGTLTDVTDHAAEWLGLTTPHALQTDYEYATR